ncbi:hypothetical protein PIB30_069189 [Stylosanthes scabra]|uniref:Uncharacterized protein n=1 Tax=Stylosanthes scabra TaxID=79078 RepID=A0ABU6XP00_9FABA|nr:hypothetical protein [Stylosanthes scabra]
MASFRIACLVVLLVLVVGPLAVWGAEKGAAVPLSHKGGRLLSGNLNIGILWYGAITKEQKDAILSFLKSLNSPSGGGGEPQVSSWWHVVESYQAYAKGGGPGGNDIPKITVNVVSEQFDPNYSLGKVLIKDFIKKLIPKATGGKSDTLALIIASKGVTVQEMCAGSCAQHGLIEQQPYVAVGDPEEECPECAWPFLEAPGISLKPPSGAVGADAMVMLLAGGLAGAVTNPYGDGFYADARGDDILEATSVCSRILSAQEAKLPVDPVSGGAYNANGVAGTKFFLPAIWNPKTSSCWTPL